MAASFGKLNLILSADPTGVASGLQSAAQMLGSFGKDAFNLLGQAFSDPGRAIADMTGKIGDMMGSLPVVGGLLGLPFQAASGAMGVLLDTFDEGKKRIKEMGAAAARTGLDISSYQLLSHAMEMGGLSAEQAEKGIFHFQRTLAEAELAAVGTRTAFDNLGLNGKELAALARTDMPAAFGKVADAFKGLGSGAAQAHAAFSLFSKSGAVMLPTLLRGSEWIEKNKGWMDQFGLGFGQADLANVRQVGYASKMFGMMKEGFGNQVTIAVAPVLAELSDYIPKLTIGAKGLADTLVNGFEAVAKGIAFVADNWGDWDTIWEAMGIGWNSLVALMEEGIAQILELFPSLTKEWAKQWEQLANIAGLLGPAGIGAASAASGIAAVLNGADQGGIAKNFKTDAASRRKQAEDDAWFLWFDQQELAEKGLNKAGLAVDRFFTGVRERMKAGGQDMGEGMMAGFLERFYKLEDATKGPLENFKNKTGEIVQLLGAAEKMNQPKNGLMGALMAGGFGAAGMPMPAGGPGMFGDVLNLSMYKAGMDMINAFGTKSKFAAAMQEGSTGAYSTVAAYQDQSRLSVEEQMRMALYEANKQRERHIAIGQQMVDAVKGIQGKGF